MSHAWEVFLHYLPIALVVLPSLITALTSYPRAGGAVKALKVVLNLLSVLTHSDSPGTLKMPFTMSSMPTGGPLSDHAGPIKLSALLPFLFIAMAPTLMGAKCSQAQSAYGAAFASCMESKGISAATSVGSEAWTDLSNGVDTATIETQLIGLAGRAGTDAVTCAVTSWLNAPVKASRNPAGVAAAQAWLSSHKG